MQKALLLTISSLFLLCSFAPKKKKQAKLKLSKEFVKIPGGKFSLNPDSNMVSVDGFYMSKYEVSNLQYRTFFNEVSVGMTEEAKQMIACDSTGWETKEAKNETLKAYYFSDTRFNNYPMLNVRFEGAESYCKWLQQKIENENPNFSIEVKLPTNSQWSWAARGGRSQAMFPWGNYYLRNNKGQPMCNFKQVKDGHIYRDRKTGKPVVAVMPFNVNEKVYYTSSVQSYWPNDYGLYNMCGNVAEMIAKKGVAMGGSWNDYGGDINTSAIALYEKSSPTVGFRPIVIIKAKTGL